MTGWRVTVDVIRDGKAEYSVTMDRTPFTLGSSPDSDLVLGDPRVSRTHARVFISRGGIVYQDQSLNGSFVQGRRVTECRVESGGVVGVPPFELRFQLLEQSSGDRTVLSGGHSAQRRRSKPGLPPQPALDGDPEPLTPLLPPPLAGPVAMSLPAGAPSRSSPEDPTSPLPEGLARSFRQAEARLPRAAPGPKGPAGSSTSPRGPAPTAEWPQPSGPAPSPSPAARESSGLAAPGTAPQSPSRDSESGRRPSRTEPASPPARTLPPTPSAASSASSPPMALPSSASAADIQVVVLEGPQQLKGRTFAILGPRSVIGRTPEAAVPLPHGVVSREHASLEPLADGGVILKDLGSANGTYVGEEKIRERRLQAGDSFSLGRKIVLLVRRRPPAARSPSTSGVTAPKPAVLPAREAATPSPPRREERVPSGAFKGPVGLPEPVDEPTEATVPPLRLGFRRIGPSGKILVVDVAGHIDVCNYSLLADRLRQAVDAGERAIVISLDGVSFMDHASLGVLVQVHSRLKELNGQMRLTGVKGRLRETFSLSRLDSLFADCLAEGEAAAVRSLTRSVRL